MNDAPPRPITQQVRHDVVGSVSYVAGVPISTIEIPRLGAIDHVMLQLSGQITVTSGNNTLAKTLRSGEWGAVSKIEFVENGSTVTHTFTPDMLMRYNQIFLGIDPDIEPAIGGGAADPTFASVLPIFFALPKRATKRGLDTALPAYKLAKLEMKIYWNPSTSINGDAATYAVAPSIQITQFYRFGNPDLQYTRVRHAIYEPTAFASALTNQRIPFNPNVVVRQLLINTRNASDVDAGGLIQNIKLTSGSTVFRTYPTDRILREEYRQVWGNRSHFNRALASGLGAIAQAFQSAKSALAGWQPVEMAMDGNSTESFDTRGWNSAELYVDPTAACSLKILSVEFEGPF